MFYVLKLIINSSLTLNKRNHCCDFSKPSLLITKGYHQGLLWSRNQVFHLKSSTALYFLQPASCCLDMKWKPSQDETLLCVFVLTTDISLWMPPKHEQVCWSALSLTAGGRGFPPATFVVKLNQKSTPFKHTKTTLQTKCKFHLQQA